MKTRAITTALIATITLATAGPSIGADARIAELEHRVYQLEQQNTPGRTKPDYPNRTDAELCDYLQSGNEARARNTVGDWTPPPLPTFCK